MNIQYYGHSCFKITTKPAGRATEDVVIFVDPFDKSVGLRPPQGQADIVFISHLHHDDHNNTKALKGDPIIIDSPGEYSVKGINAVGIDSSHDKKEGIEQGKNTIFVLESEDIKICHLGDLGTDLTESQLEEINGVDILFVPIGGKTTIDGIEASKIVRKIEPSVVVPMHYKVKGTKMNIENEKKFCGEMNCPKEVVSRVTLKKKDLDGKNMEVMLMNID